MLPTITDAAQIGDPGVLPPPITARRGPLYLVGEAERSTQAPATTVGRTMISVNGRWTALRGRSATYAQLLRIAFPDREGQDPGVATVSFRHTLDARLSGLLTPGDMVPLTGGLLVNVNATYAS